MPTTLPAVFARSVAVRVPPSSCARSPTIAPGRALHDLAVDDDLEHSIEHEVHERGTVTRVSLFDEDVVRERIADALCPRHP